MNKTSISTLQGGKYQVQSLIGCGGFGNTYLATQVALGRKVAIKEFFMKEFCERDESTSRVIVPTEGSRLIVDKYKQKFLKEAQMIASLKNEHIVQIYDIFEENNTAYYVMQYIEEGSLKDKVESKGAISEREAVRYIMQVADALSYLHSQNILHLDIKPANILINELDSPILIDFGISKHYDTDGGQTSTTPAGISKGYAPIEQYQQGSIANFTPATDVYSLGATLYFLLTGATPPDAMDVTNEGLDETPLSRNSASVRKAVVAAMQARRKDRPQTIMDFKALIKVNEAAEEEETTVLINPVVNPVVQEEEEKKVVTVEKKAANKPNLLIYLLAALAALAGAFIVWNYLVADNETVRVSDPQLDSVNYFVGVNLGSFIKVNTFAESLDELNWRKIQSGIKDYYKAKGNPYDADFGRQFKIDPNEMSDILNRYLYNKSSGLPVSVDSVSYLLGLNIASFMKSKDIIESETDLNYELLHLGVEEFLKAKGSPDDDDFGRQFTINPDYINDVLTRRVEQVKAYKAASNKAEGEKFFKENARRNGVKTTASGLQYKIIREGGSYKVGPRDTVRVNYTGKFIDGTVFDEGYDINFAANQVIKGWTEGLGYLGEGGKAVFYIPSELAYGERGVRNIGPNTALIFDVEVLKVMRKR